MKTNTEIRTAIKAIIENRLNNNQDPGAKPQSQPQVCKDLKYKGKSSGPAPKRSRFDYCQSWNLNKSYPPAAMPKPQGAA